MAFGAWDRVLTNIKMIHFQSGPSFAKGPRFLPILTRRQRDVYDHVVRGFTDDETARSLAISVATVETHRRDVQRKLGCRGHNDVVSHGLRHGIIDPPHSNLTLRNGGRPAATVQRPQRELPVFNTEAQI